MIAGQEATRAAIIHAASKAGEASRLATALRGLLLWTGANSLLVSWLLGAGETSLGVPGVVDLCLAGVLGLAGAGLVGAFLARSRYLRVSASWLATGAYLGISGIFLFGAEHLMPAVVFASVASVTATVATLGSE